MPIPYAANQADPKVTVEYVYPSSDRHRVSLVFHTTTSLYSVADKLSFPKALTSQYPTFPTAYEDRDSTTHIPTGTNVGYPEPTDSSPPRSSYVLDPAEVFPLSPSQNFGESGNQYTSKHGYQYPSTHESYFLSSSTLIHSAPFSTTPIPDHVSYFTSPLKPIFPLTVSENPYSDSTGAQFSVSQPGSHSKYPTVSYNPEFPNGSSYPFSTQPPQSYPLSRPVPSAGSIISASSYINVASFSIGPSSRPVKTRSFFGARNISPITRSQNSSAASEPPAYPYKPPRPEIHSILSLGQGSISRISSSETASFHEPPSVHPPTLQETRVRNMGFSLPPAISPSVPIVLAQPDPRIGYEVSLFFCLFAISRQKFSEFFSDNY